jgi:prepilin-type N-terminal cleavage/methylation domain-containing protein
MKPTPTLLRCVARPRAFTLIELLTVIAIIGILAAILIPTVGRVRVSAKASTSASNLRQLSSAHNLYAAERRDSLVSGPKDADGNAAWHGQLYGYVPRALRTTIFQNPNAASNIVPSAIPFNTYSINPNLNQGEGQPFGTKVKYYKLNEIKSPSRFIVWTDGYQRGNGTASAQLVQTWITFTGDKSLPLAGDTANATGNGYIAYPNGGKGHASRLDGSVFIISPGQLTYAELAPGS